MALILNFLEENLIMLFKEYLGLVILEQEKREA